jgi:hypothetical protein
MTDTGSVPFGAVRLADVLRATDIDSDHPDIRAFAPAGTLVFVRDPALVRRARATIDGRAILAIGGRPGAAFAVSRGERAWFPVAADV